MSDNRTSALALIVQNIDCPVYLVGEHNFRYFEDKEIPIHPGYEYLSETHRADYLRAYLAHFCGGGYTDIKRTYKSWRQIFDNFNESNFLMAGYPEDSPNHVAPVGGELEQRLKQHYKSLLGMCSYIVRPRTELTSSWILQVHNILDAKIDALRTNPAQHPQDVTGRQKDNGQLSQYPLKWTEILGNVLHPLLLNFEGKLHQVDMAPSFADYR